MDTSKDCEQAAAEASGDWDVSEEDAEWERSCHQPDRGHVSVLMDISEETSFKDQEPFEFICLAGWEQAIQGWGRAPPLSCLFQPQRRGKRAKAGEPDQHCLLCVDIKLCEPQESDSSGPSPESCCEPGLEDYLKRPQRSTQSSGPYRHASDGRSARVGLPSPEQDPLPAESPCFSALRKATRRLSLRDKMAEEKAELGGPGECPSPRQPSVALSQPEHPAAGCPIFRKDGNATLVINSFAVLPPVQASQTRQTKALSGPSRRAEAVRGAETAEAASRRVTPAGESDGGGAERGEQTQADSAPNAGASDGTSYRGVVTSKFWPSQQSHHLLSAFSIPVPKRYEGPLGSLANPPPRSSNPLGRHHRQEPPRNSTGGQRLYVGLRAKSVRSPDPQLPILLGTRVLIPASAHRLR